MTASGTCAIGRAIPRCRVATVVVVLLVGISAAPLATAQVKGGPQKTFPTPEAAAGALAAAYQQGDSMAVANVLGDKALRLVFSGDAVKELAVGDITQMEPNIHAGVKYMRFMMDQFYANEPMDRLNKGLFTFASYNAGRAASSNCEDSPPSAASIPTSGSTMSS